MVILIDALGGNAIITVGPTVQKTVWVDAGAGDDVVTIRSGNAILVDKSESSLGSTGKLSRNDIPVQAFALIAPNESDVNTTFSGKTLDDGVVTFTGLSIDSPTDVDWYRFSLAEVAAATSTIEIASGSPIDELSIEIWNVADVNPQTGAPIVDGIDPGTPRTPLTLGGFSTTGDSSTLANLSSLLPNTDYFIKVSSPNIVPTLYDLRLNLVGVDLTTLDVPLEVSLSLREAITRRDVILGGDGNDILQGGAGEDWIFGNDGNDVLTGESDRQASDLLFGGDGDDTFQIIPDALPLLGNQPGTNFDPATQTYIPTQSDQFIGGDGTDRVLFLGGDLDWTVKNDCYCDLR